MATIYPPNNRNLIGEAQKLKWETTTPIIDGWHSDFSSIEGGETVTITLYDGLGGIADSDTVEMQAGDIDANLVADRINTRFPGIAVPHNVGRRLSLRYQTGIEVESCRETFRKIGLPNEKRLVTPPSPIYKPPLVRSKMRNAERSSLPVDVPNEANKLGLWMTLLPDVADYSDFNPWGLVVLPMWSNGVIDDISPTHVGAIPIVNSGDPWSNHSDFNPVRNFAMLGDARFLAGSAYMMPTENEPYSCSLSRYLELDVPVGATTFRLMLGEFRSMNNEGPDFYGMVDIPPMYPPNFACSAVFGVRNVATAIR